MSIDHKTVIGYLTIFLSAQAIVLYSLGIVLWKFSDEIRGLLSRTRGFEVAGVKTAFDAGVVTAVDAVVAETLQSKAQAIQQEAPSAEKDRKIVELEEETEKLREKLLSAARSQTDVLSTSEDGLFAVLNNQELLTTLAKTYWYARYLITTDFDEDKILALMKSGHPDSFPQSIKKSLELARMDRKRRGLSN